MEVHEHQQRILKYTFIQKTFLEDQKLQLLGKGCFPRNISTVLIITLLASSELGYFWCRVGWRAAVARVFTCARSVARVQSFPWIMWSAEKVERARRGNADLETCCVIELRQANRHVAWGENHCAIQALWLNLWIACSLSTHLNKM